MPLNSRLERNKEEEKGLETGLETLYRRASGYERTTCTGYERTPLNPQLSTRFASAEASAELKLAWAFFFITLEPRVE